MLPLYRCDFRAQIHQNAYAAGASLQTPLGKLTELPDPLVGFQEPLRGKGGEERRGEGKDGGKGKGSIPPLLFTIDLMTAQQ